MKRQLYRALKGLSYPTDPKVIRRLKAGESVPWAQRKAKDVTAGEIVDDVPKDSVPWLLDQGIIEEVTDDEV